MVALITTLLLAGAPAHAGPKIKLAYASQPGRTVAWELTYEGRGAMTIQPVGQPAMEVPVSADMSLRYRFIQRASAGPDEVHGDIQLERMELTVQAPRPQHFVSSGEGTTLDGTSVPVTDAMRSMFDRPALAVRSDLSGSVLDLTEAPGAPEEARDVAKSIQVVMVPLPEKGKARVGQSWTAVRNVPISALGRSIPLESTWTLESVEDGVALLSTRGTYTTSEGAAGPARSGTELDLRRVTYTVTGTARFDLDERELVTVALDYGIKFEAEMAEPATTVTADLPGTYILRRADP